VLEKDYYQMFGLNRDTIPRSVSPGTLLRAVSNKPKGDEILLGVRII
jgi:hypothetical protein